MDSPNIHDKRAPHVTQCSCGNKPPNRARATIASTATPAPLPFTVDCESLPTDVVVKVGPIGTDANAILCTEVQSLQDEDPSFDNATSLTQWSVQYPTELHAKRALGMAETVRTGSISLSSILVLLFLGSTLWYRRKYHQALNFNLDTTS